MLRHLLKATSNYRVGIIGIPINNHSNKDELI